MFPIITLTGTPYARGQQYGKQAAAQIRHSIASYALLFAHDRGIHWDDAQQLAANYVPILQQHAAPLLEEMQGIADAAGVHLLEIVALNARTELLAGSFYHQSENYPAAQAYNVAHNVPQIPAMQQRTECTTVAAQPTATRTRSTLLAQTWDWVKMQRDACVVLQIKPANPGDLTIVTLTEAGIVGKIGLNSAGLGVCLNILSSTDDGSRVALPIHVLLRMAMAHPDVASALALLHDVRGAASSCITLADAEGHACCVEITPSATAIIQPHDGVLAHTNHCLADAPRLHMTPLLPASSSEPRYYRASALLRQHHGQLDAPTLMLLLRDEQDAPLCICRTSDDSLHPADQVETVAAVVLDLAQRVMHLAPDRPCATDFVALAMPTA